MPLLAYFGVVGAMLLGLLFVAEAHLGPPAAPMSISTNFYGLPAPYKAARTTILTARDAPAPDIAATSLAQHAPVPATSTTAAAQPAAQPAMSGDAPLKIRVTKSAPKTKKTAKPAQKPGRNMFAGSPSQAHRVW